MENLVNAVANTDREISSLIDINVTDACSKTLSVPVKTTNNNNDTTADISMVSIDEDVTMESIDKVDVSMISINDTKNSTINSSLNDSASNNNSFKPKYDITGNISYLYST